MRLSLKTHDGSPENPVVVLIHGLGMNNYFWVDPKKCSVLGGLAPLTVFLADPERMPANTLSFGSVGPKVEGLWNYLKAAGFSLVSWTQSQPLGPIHIAIGELEAALSAAAEKWPGRPVYLIGHSRGGLIARSLLLGKPETDVKGLITICSPHSGTDMAKFSGYLKPAGSLLEKIIPRKSKVMLTKALGRLSEFLQSPAIGELTPDSDYLKSIKKPLPEQLKKLSFGGTSPALFQLTVRLPADNHKTIKFPDLLAAAVPSEHLPKELTPGLGDALVSAASARLPDSTHHDFAFNHVRAAYDRNIHKLIVNFLSRDAR
jgi:pimeloyl-ACP methyl ester carboxylesterase